MIAMGRTIFLIHSGLMRETVPSLASIHVRRSGKDKERSALHEMSVNLRLRFSTGPYGLVGHLKRSTRVEFVFAAEK